MVLRIVQLTDLHLPRRLDNRRWHAFEKLVAELPERVGAIDRLVITGDLAASGNFRVYRKLSDLLFPWRDKLRVLAGNHDDSRQVRDVFDDRLTSNSKHSIFVDEVQGVRLVGLDTSRPYRVSGKLGSSQLTWLAELLKDSLPTLLFMHHPPIAIGTWWLDKDVLRDRDDFRKLVNTANVLAVICGHVHQPFEGKLGNVPVWTTPSTAYQFLPGSWIPRTESSKAGFRVIECSAAKARSFMLHQLG
jgi:Icc protein